MEIDSYPKCLSAQKKPAAEKELHQMDRVQLGMMCHQSQFQDSSMCNEEQEIVRDRLMTELDFHVSIATAYAKSDGRCEYCKRDLIHDRLGYGCAQKDHLLPTSRFEANIAELPENWVLSCSICNGIKADHCVLLNGEDPIEMLIHHRNALIERVWQFIQPTKEQKDEDWETAREIILGVSSH